MDKKKSFLLSYLVKLNSDQINRSRQSAMAEDLSAIFSMETCQSNVRYAKLEKEWHLLVTFIE